MDCCSAWSMRWWSMLAGRSGVAGCCALALVLMAAADAMAQAKPAAPKAVFVLRARDSKVTPFKSGYSATGGGTVQVTQAAPDTIVINMSGVAATGACACGTSRASLSFVLDQEFEVEFDPKGPGTGQIVLEARAYGQLRVDGKKGGGTASLDHAFADVSCGESLVSVTLDPQMAACGDGLAVTSVRGPVAAPISAGVYHLHQEFSVSASNPHCLLPRKASADFAPPPTLEAKWLPHPDPFREVNRTSNGFQVTVRLIADPPVPDAVLPPPPK